MKRAFTKVIIYAAAMDAAKRSVRNRGGTIMDNKASDAYFAEFERLYEAIGGNEGWMELPRE